ncbi:Nephrocystin-3 [Durusdinium trenchii]|uniref:Nephrocystin-3 n=1 Tax=Durusdinium trenchii TaxID=1381693 RepID=A0ABP0R562_9DINO
MLKRVSRSLRRGSNGKDAAKMTEAEDVDRRVGPRLTNGGARLTRMRSLRKAGSKKAAAATKPTTTTTTTTQHCGAKGRINRGVKLGRLEEALEAAQREGKLYVVMAHVGTDLVKGVTVKFQGADSQGDKAFRMVETRHGKVLRVKRLHLGLKKKSRWTLQDMADFFPLSKKDAKTAQQPYDEEEEPFAGWAVIAARQLPMGKALDTLRGFFEGDDASSKVVWLDVLHPEASQSALSKAVVEFDKHVVLVDQWDEPLVASRAWCVEVMMAVKTFDLAFAQPLDNVGQISILLEALGKVSKELGSKFAAILLEKHFDDILGESQHLDEDQVAFCASMLNSTGAVLGEQGELESALAYLEKARELYQRAQRQEDPALLVNIGMIYQRQGKFDDALEALVQGLDSCGPDAPESRNKILHAIAVAKQHQGDLAGAFTAFENLIKRSPNDPALHSHLGAVLEAQGQYEAAHTAFTDALALYTAQLGPRHLRVGKTHENLGLVAHHLGQFDKALTHYTKARDIYTSPEDTDRVASKLATTYLELGQFDQCQRFMAAQSNSSDAAFAAVCHRTGMLDKAVELYEACILQLERKHGTRSHIDVAKALNNLGLVCIDLERFPRALANFREALAITPTSHPLIVTVTSNIALVKLRQRNIDDALDDYAKSLALCADCLGKNHPTYARTLVHIATAFHLNGNNAQALVSYQQAHTILQDALGPRHPELATAKTAIAAILQAQRNHRKASIYLASALDITQEAYGAEHPTTKAIHGKLQQLQDETME